MIKCKKLNQKNMKNVSYACSENTKKNILHPESRMCHVKYHKYEKHNKNIKVTDVSICAASLFDFSLQIG